MKKKFIGLIALLVLITVGGILFYRSLHTAPKDILRLYGNVDVRQVDLGFRVLGRVNTLKFEEGDFVKTGELVATLDKQPYLDQAHQASANVEFAKASLNYAEMVFDRRAQLIGDGSVSQEDFENALTNKETLNAELKQAESAMGVAITNLKDTEVFAPNSGVILTRIKEPGSIVNVGDPVYTLSLTDPIWVRAYVSEKDLGNIYFGMQAKVYTDTENAQAYTGHIGFISPVAEFTPKTVETPELRTELVYRLRVIVDNPDNRLKQGMPVTVELKKHDNDRNSQ